MTQALRGVRGLAKVLLMEQRDNFKARNGTVFLSTGFEKTKSVKLVSSKTLEQLISDDGTDGDYAPDVLNPYTPSGTVKESRDECFGDKLFEMHKKTVSEFVVERARSGLPVDQAAVDLVLLKLPFLFKLIERG